MPKSTEEQLSDIYCLIDELNDVEVRLRNAVDNVKEALEPIREENDDHP